MTRLGLVLDQIIFQQQDRFSTDEVFIRYMESLTSTTFDCIDFCSRVRHSPESAAYPLDPERFRIVALPWYANISRLCLGSPWLLPRAARALSAAMPEWDLLIASGLHPLTPLALRMARRRGLPAVLWIRGDMEQDLRFRLKGARRWMAMAALKAVQAALPRQTPVISVGRDDYPFLKKLGPVHVTYSSKFNTSDFRPSTGRPGVCSIADGRLLYVGRIAPEKGLGTLLEAMHILAAQREGPPSLTIVGDDYHGSAYGAQFRRQVATSGLAGRVQLAGHVPYGPRLFEYYDSHSCLILPSFTEGFPQVLLEAMIRGLPVVATKVGGVPLLIQHETNGLLLPPGRPRLLADAIERLLTDESLAQRLVRAGQQTARGYTQDVLAEAVLEFLAGRYPQAAFARRRSLKPR